MNIIVGSEAAKIFSIARRDPIDRDIWVHENQDQDYLEMLKIGGFEITVMPDYILDQVPHKFAYATPDALYTIKCSHFGWNIKWDKTLQDILWFKHKGCKLIPELYYLLKDYWKQEHGNKEFLSLNKDSKEFFHDKVTYLFPHDDLHQYVANNNPVYKKCLKDGQDVLIDKNKFDNMSHEDKVKMFKEEIAVIAAERWLINPYWRGKVSWVRAWRYSLQKTITNLTKNWATDFIIFHLEDFIKPDREMMYRLIEKTEIGESVMSDVDLSVFEEIAGDDYALDDLIHEMCEGDFAVPVDGMSFPERGDRKWGDESFQKEISQYWKDLQEAREERGKELGIEYEHLEQEGGGEGGSEYCYGVFKLNGKIYRGEYSYYSHHGDEYDGIASTLKEVKPVQKTVTVYE